MQPETGTKPESTTMMDWPALFQARAEATTGPALKKFYSSGTVSPDTPLSQVPFVALDLETTGLDPELHGILSVGLVPFTIRRIHCRRARYWVVRPRRELPDASVAIHRITHQALLEAPDLLDILDDLLDALAGTVAVVHYRGIERPFLRRAVRERLGERLDFPVVDTMELEARVHRRQKGPVTRFVAGAFGRTPPSIRLAASRARYHLPMYGAHHALTDAVATAELLQAQVAYRYTPDTLVREIWR